MTPVRTTIVYLQARQNYRAQGGQVSFADDPAWLINQAINRRAGWPDDPSLSRGSCYPVRGRYPKKAEGDVLNNLHNLAWEINHNIVVRPHRIMEFGAYGKRLMARIRPERLTCPWEE